MKVRFIKPDEAEMLEEFVAAHEHGCIEQTWAWAELQMTLNGRDAIFVFGVFEGEGAEEKLLASMMVIRQDAWRGKTWLWSPRGPILPRSRKKAEAAWRLLKKECKKFARAEGDVFLRVEPGMPKEVEFKLGGRKAAESYMPENTLMIDLTVSEDRIREQMKQKGRYNIRQAEKAGVYVLQSDGVDFDEFYDLLKETAERDGFHLHDKGFYKHFLELLDDRSFFYLAKKAHKLLGGIFVTHFGDTATYYFGASGGAHRKDMAPYALQWFAIQKAKAAGMKHYDFLGVAPAEDGRTNEKHRLAGVTQFKTRFGGKRVDYKKARVFVYRPFWWLIYKLAKLAKR